MSTRKQLPPRDLQWIDAQGRPTEIFFDYIKNLESRSLGQAVSVTDTPANGQFLIYGTATAKWSVGPATAPANGEVLIWSSGTGTWVPGAN